MKLFEKYDCRDIVTMGVFIVATVAIWVYAFKHPSDTNFATACTATTAMGGIFHWICTYDSKKPDAPCP